MSDEELIIEFVKKISSGEITFDKIRPQLQQLGIEEARIKQIVRQVDDEIQSALLAKSTATSLDRIILYGTVLVVVGVAITLASFAGFISFGNSYMVVVAFGPIVAGMVFIVVGKRRKNRITTSKGADSQTRAFNLRDRRTH